MFSSADESTWRSGRNSVYLPLRHECFHQLMKAHGVAVEIPTNHREIPGSTPGRYNLQIEITSVVGSRIGVCFSPSLSLSLSLPVCLCFYVSMWLCVCVSVCLFSVCLLVCVSMNLCCCLSLFDYYPTFLFFGIPIDSLEAHSHRESYNILRVLAPNSIT